MKTYVDSKTNWLYTVNEETGESEWVMDPSTGRPASAAQRAGEEPATSASASRVEEKPAGDTAASAAAAGREAEADPYDYSAAIGDNSSMGRRPKKKHGCRNVFLVAAGLLVVLLVLGSLLPKASITPESVKGTEWGDALLSALDEAGIDDVKEMSVEVTLDEKDDEGHFVQKEGREATGEFDNMLFRHVDLVTEGGRTLGVSFLDESKVSMIEDRATDEVFWETPDSEGRYTFNVISYKTGELLHEADPELNAREMARRQESKEEWDREFNRNLRGYADFFDQIKDSGLTEQESDAMYDILQRCGVGSIEGVSNTVANENLKVFMGTCNGHQVNITTDNNVVFYVQITGWTEETMGWYENWRGRLKYGVVENRVAFDLYDEASGGLLARYNSAKDEVEPV